MMNYTLRQLRAFRCIAAHRNITHAAQELGLTQSGLSAMLRELEIDAGEALFERTTRRIDITPAGMVFHALAERVLGEAETLDQEFHEYRTGARGILRLGALPSLSAQMLPRLLTSFRSDHPFVEVELVEGHAGTLFSMVSEGALSIALGTAFARARHLRQETLWRDEIVAAVPMGHNLVGAGPIRWRDLADLDFIAIKDTSSLRKLSDAGFEVAGTRPRMALEVASMATAVAFARSGAGFTILPRSALEMLCLDGLEILHLKEPSLWRDISMITPERLPNQVSIAFRDLVLRERSSRSRID
ncbi:LysR family transcriptional regulator [Tianweitania populi]|uniref:LysR family transcriptional regulator n=1 Tax=Tianweitania populi TaxID=1607949 RepID=A0A8J3DWV0_9HYPH|nr:LysR family transcriptional regulator [Tianweitania populi]GHD20699.1 LysR family transcriptional regulator [Tianweitania populi]